ncbi:MAG: hypothetical protein IPJ41_12300 [Phycisphaerales bacterium]|nr:hypothetical protein [Phycisphaerales bacterium]
MAHEAPLVALVGHCGPDCFALKAALRRYAPDAEFVFVNDGGSLGALAEGAVMLVNRLLDGEFSTGSGIDLIAMLPESRRGRAALVSNIARAQAEAVRAGATSGFGKTELYSDKARGCMLSLLGRGGE